MAIPADVETRIRDTPVSAHLATSVDDRPHVAPVWYGYRDGTLYCITGGRKLENVQQNHRVALSIEQASGGDVDWNVTILGRARVVTDPERIEWAEGWIYDRYGGLEDEEGADSTADESENDETEREMASEPDLEDPETEPDWEYALLEVQIGSTALSVYD